MDELDDALRANFADAVLSIPSDRLRSTILGPVNFGGVGFGGGTGGVDEDADEEGTRMLSGVTVHIELGRSLRVAVPPAEEDVEGERNLLPPS